MSKLFTDNKQMMVHIVSEVVVLVGLTFYFNQKNKKLMAHIEDLAQRIEEQEDLLQKHDQIIKQLVDHVSKQQVAMQQQVTAPVRTANVIKKASPRRKLRVKRRLSSPPPTTPPVEQHPVRVHFAEDKDPDPESESESETEADLDNELQEELNDLVETDTSLKKEGPIDKDNAA